MLLRPCFRVLRAICVVLEVAIKKRSIQTFFFFTLTCTCHRVGDEISNAEAEMQELQSATEQAM